MISVPGTGYGTVSGPTGSRCEVLDVGLAMSVTIDLKLELCIPEQRVRIGVGAEGC